MVKFIACIICYNYYECHWNLSVHVWFACYININAWVILIYNSCGFKITLVLTSMRQPLYTIHFHPPSLGSGKTGMVLNMTCFIRCSRNMLQKDVLWEVHFPGPLLWVYFYIINSGVRTCSIVPCVFSQPL